LQRSG